MKKDKEFKTSAEHTEAVEDSSLAKDSSYTKVQRMLARAALGIIFLLLLALVITLVTGGSKNLLLLILFLLIVVPAVIYAFMMYVNHTTKR